MHLQRWLDLLLVLLTSLPLIASSVGQADCPGDILGELLKTCMPLMADHLTFLSLK